MNENHKGEVLMKSLLIFFYITIITLLTSTISYSQTLRFPEDLDGIYKKWEGMTDIQKKEFLQGYNGNLISGSGKIFSVEDGGSIFGCKRSKHTWLFGIFPDCYKVSVIRIAPECVTRGLDAFGIKIPGVQECLKLHTTELYFSKKEKVKLLNLKNGETLNFSNCKILDIWNNFFSHVYCDAQFSININQETKQNINQRKTSSNQYEKLSSSDGYVNFYLDTASLKKMNNGEVSANFLTDFITCNMSCMGDSQIEKVIFNCNNKKFKVIEMNWYEDHMGKGKKDPYLSDIKNPEKPANIWKSTDKLNNQYYKPALDIVCS